MVMIESKNQLGVKRINFPSPVNYLSSQESSQENNQTKPSKT